jgi:hypothetical protein
MNCICLAAAWARAEDTAENLVVACLHLVIYAYRAMVPILHYLCVR